MANLGNLSGVIPPLATPLTEDYKVDKVNLRKLTRFMIEGGGSALFVMGSTGEFPAFTRDERKAILKTVVDETGGKIAVLAGISDSATRLAVMNAHDAEEVGADAVVLTMPYYFRASGDQDALDHYRFVAKNTSLPLIVYNVPQAVKSPVSADVVVQLAEEGTAVAIKDSSTDFNHFQSLVQRLAHLPHFRIFQGSEFQMAASVLMGAHGGVLGIANVIPHLCVKLYEAASQGRVEEARELQRRVTAVSQVFWAGESPLGGLKTAISMVGFGGPTASIPIQPLSPKSQDKIRKILVDNGII